MAPFGTLATQAPLGYTLLIYFAGIKLLSYNIVSSSDGSEHLKQFVYASAVQLAHE